jgi:branched-chain amino acid transport system permease protein
VELFAQALVSGLAQGCVYALVATGFVIIYKATEVPNFAQGEMTMVGAYIYFSLVTMLGFPRFLALGATLILAGLLGALIERTVIHPISDEPPFIAIMATIGLAILLRGLTGIVWSHDTHAFPSPIPDRTFEAAGVVVSSADLWAFSLVAVVALLLFAFFRWTRVGIAMRAVAQNRYAAQLMGIRVQRVFTLSWVLAGAVGALAGVLLADLNYLHTNMGTIIMVALVAAVLGGLESIPGAVLGGLFLGVVANLSGTYLDRFMGGGAKDVTAFAVLLIVLLIRPYGFFGIPDTKRV